MGALAILLLAAGRASRMRGADKLLERVDGVALIRRQALAALSTGCPVVVALPLPEGDRGAALSGLDLTRVTVPDAAEGMAASIRAGTAALSPDATGVMILPADMPELTGADLRTMADGFCGRTLRATGADGTPGHPVIFPAASFGALAALRGDTGARALLAEGGVDTLPLPARHALTDLDTPEDWAAWRAQGPERG